MPRRRNQLDKTALEEVRRAMAESLKTEAQAISNQITEKVKEARDQALARKVEITQAAKKRKTPAGAKDPTAESAAGAVKAGAVPSSGSSAPAAAEETEASRYLEKKRAEAATAEAAKAASKAAA